MDAVMSGDYRRRGRNLERVRGMAHTRNPPAAGALACLVRLGKAMNKRLPGSKRAVVNQATRKPPQSARGPSQDAPGPRRDAPPRPVYPSSVRRFLAQRAERVDA